MIMAPEQAALKAKEQFDSLLGLVQEAVRDGDRIDPLEREDGTRIVRRAAAESAAP
jgi:hypothetical protein